MRFLESPKAPVSEQPLQVNMLRDPKHSGSLQGSFLCKSPVNRKQSEFFNIALSRFEMLGTSFNTLTADRIHSRQNREKIRQQVPPQLCSESKTFSESSISFLKSI